MVAEEKKTEMIDEQDQIDDDDSGDGDFWEAKVEKGLDSSQNNEEIVMSKIKDPRDSNPRNSSEQSSKVYEPRQTIFDKQTPQSIEK